MTFTYYPNDFWHKRKTYNFDPYSLLLAIATNIPQRLKTGFVLQGPILCIICCVNEKCTIFIWSIDGYAKALSVFLTDKLYFSGLETFQ